MDKIEEMEADYKFGPPMTEKRCLKCNGTGKAMAEKAGIFRDATPCKHCDGKGFFKL
ncbi:MAG: hypothetical protein KAJ19_11985 [Gammaproteobacteria bacterium]|nr:hypothetical protein [Gammaproteobacteria bacterium]